MGITIYDVAKHAGVGLGTVSRVLNEHPSVSQKTRKKVLKTIEKLGYSPHAMARGLALNRTNSIGIVVPFFTHHFFIEILKGIQDASYELRQDIILYNVQSTIQKENYLENILTTRKVDGVIIITLKVLDRHLKALEKAKIPAVLIDTYHKNAYCIRVDNIAGAEIAIRHLLSLGHKNIRFINGLKKYQSSRDRLIGCKRALKSLNNDCIKNESEVIVESEFSRKEGYKAMEKLYKLDNSITAVFAASDLQALGAIEYLSSSGIDVPEQISIIGYDNIEMAEVAGLTTISQPMHEMGYIGLQTLVKNINYIKSKKEDDIPITNREGEKYLPQLVIRRSTAPCNQTN